MGERDKLTWLDEELHKVSHTHLTHEERATLLHDTLCTFDHSGSVCGFYWEDSWDFPTHKEWMIKLKALEKEGITITQVLEAKKFLEKVNNL